MCTNCGCHGPEKEHVTLTVEGMSCGQLQKCGRKGGQRIVRSDGG